MEFSEIMAEFEAYVLKLRIDLKKYASRSDAQPSVIEYRIDQIDKLVDFHNAFEMMVSDLEMEVIEKTIAYNKLHADAQKLVTFCELHRVNPNMIFYYDQYTLTSMQKKGMRIIPPLRLFNDARMKFNDATTEPYNMEDISQEEFDNYNFLAFKLRISQIPENNTAA